MKSRSVFIVFLLTVHHSIFGLHESYQGRIVGGTPLSISDAPYQVQLVMNGNLLCGGSIITWHHVLSASHCFDNEKVFKEYKTKMAILAGSQKTREGNSFGVQQAYLHPKYDNITVDYDVSVLLIRGTFEGSPNQVPIALSTRKDIESLVGLECMVSGFGKTSFKGPLSEGLRKVYVPIVDTAVCKQVFQLITPRMLCAGYLDGKQDACVGDSGGPLVHNGVQIGIVSFGIDCAKVDHPGVYVHVALVLDWVTEVIALADTNLNRFSIWK